MAVELGWSHGDIQAARTAPAFYEGVGVGLLARAHSKLLADLNVVTQPGMTIDQRTQVLSAQGQRERLLRLLRGD